MDNKQKKKGSKAKPPNVTTQSFQHSLPLTVENGSKSIHIKFKHVAIIAYLYMVIPILIFFVTWLRWYIGIPMALILGFGLYRLINSNYSKNEIVIKLPLYPLLFIAFVIFAWVWVDGPFFFQTWDYHWRNPLFRDLIDFPWPVIYSNGNSLVYYFFQWLVPALFGKLFGWTVANVVLIVWNFIGIFICYIILTHVCKAYTTGKLWGLCLILIAWGGLNEFGSMLVDIIGSGQYGLSNQFGWSDAYLNYNYQYTPNDGLIAWVFNQAIVPWIAVSLLMDNKNVRTFAFLGLCVLPFAPFPFIGLFMVFIPLFIKYLIIKKKEKMPWQNLLREIFSVPNISAILTIFTVCLFFFSCNVAGGHFGPYAPLESFDLSKIVYFVIFYFLQFGVYLIIIYPVNKKNLIFWIAAASLIIIPHIQIGYGRDFGMRASIPSLFIVMILTIRNLFDYHKNLKSMPHCHVNLRALLLIMIITITGLGVVKDFASKLDTFVETQTFPYVVDDSKTFSNQDFEGDWNINYLVPNPKEKIFYKYFARIPQEE